MENQAFFETIICWLEQHVWLCSYVLMGLAALTFFLNFILKKAKSHEQAIKNVQNTTINQAGGDIKINNDDGR